jgi:hypothetical protein
MLSPQTCPICLAKPYYPCVDAAGVIRKCHVRRMDEEHGDWCQKYDSTYRDRTLRFQLAPYRKSGGHINRKAA